jgi:hypothetical protein
MKSLLFYFLLFCSQTGFSQTSTESISVIKAKTFDTNYKDFVISESVIFAITKGDSLVKINLQNDSQKMLKADIIAVAKSKKNTILIARKDGFIFELKKTAKLKKVDYVEEKIYKILTDKNDDLIIISNKSVKYKDKKYIPQKDIPMINRFGELKKSDVIFLDNQQRIWFGYDRGEWGGDVCFFDLYDKKFYVGESIELEYLIKNDLNSVDKSVIFSEYSDKIKIIQNDTLYAFPHNFRVANIKGIAQNADGDIYVSESLMHFFVSGNLTKYKEIVKDYYKDIDITKVLNHNFHKQSIEKYIDDDVIKEFVNPQWEELIEYLGPIQYNSFDNHIYYYTNNGFFRIIENNNIYSKEFIFRPWITWTHGFENAVGYQMNVIKFEFLSEKQFVFLTSSNGIGYYDGKTIKYFQ